MRLSPATKSLQSLTGAEKISLTKVVFPFLEKSEISLVAMDIDFCLVSTHAGYALSYTQSLRANKWLRANGYSVQGLATDKAELN